MNTKHIYPRIAIILLVMAGILLLAVQHATTIHAQEGLNYANMTEIPQAEFETLVENHNSSSRVNPLQDEPTPLVLVGQLADDAKALDIHGDYAYISSNERLLSIDISEPSNPQIVDTIDSLQGFGKIAIDGDYAYVDGGYIDGINIVDISDPLSLTVKSKWGQWRHDDGVASSVDGFSFVGGYVVIQDWFNTYEIWGDDRLVSVDISNPLDPTICSIYGVPIRNSEYAESSLGATVTSGRYTYTTIEGIDGGLAVVDMTNPSEPTQIARLLQEAKYGELDALEVTSKYAYVHGSTGLTILDLSEPATPVELSFYGLPDASLVARYQSYLFFSEADKLHVVDVSDPIMPVKLSTFTGLPQARTFDGEPITLEMVVRPPYLYVAAREQGLSIYQLDLPINAAPVTSYLLPVVITPNAVSHGLVLANNFNSSEGATCFRDLSGLGNNSTCTAASCPLSGQEGPSHQSLGFDGEDDYVSIGNSDTLDTIRGEISLSAWVKTEATDGIRNIIAHGYSRQPDGEVYLRIANGSYEVGAWDGTGHKATFPLPAEDVGTWVYVVGTYDGGSWRLFRNGVEVSQAADPVGSVAVNGKWTIGASGRGDERFFQGHIDEVEIHERALTATEIQANYAHSIEAISVATCSAFGEISQAECEALVAIYQANPLSLWGEWVATESPCRQKGVTCTYKQVTELDLSETGLTTLPPEVGNLLALRILRLQGNPLSSLPAEIGTLVALKELRVDTCQLTTLPPEIGNLASLESLNVYGNKLTTLPPEIGNLANLKDLQASYNKLTSLPPEIGNLTSLHTLRVSENRLTALPEQISNLTSLVTLGVHGGWQNSHLQFFIIDTTVNGNGRIEQSPPGRFHVNGTTVQLRAIPDSGHTFVRWESLQEGDLGEQATQSIITYTISLPSEFSWSSVSYDAYFE